MHEIPLTRRHVAVDGELEAMVRLVHRRSTFGPAYRRSFVAFAAVVAVVGVVAGPGLDADAGDLAKGAVAGVVVATILAVLQWWTEMREIRLLQQPELTVGAVRHVGAIPGYFRVRGPEDDCILAVSPGAVTEADGPFTVLLDPAGGLDFPLPDELLPPELLEVLRHPAVSSLLPTRPEGGDPPLTREFLADGRWSRRFARAGTASAHRSLPWWGTQALYATLYVATLAWMQAFPSLPPLGWVVSWTVVFLVFTAWATWRAWRVAYRANGGKQGHGGRLTAGFGPSAYRVATTGYDFVTDYDLLRSVSLLGDVVRLVPRAGSPTLLPRELVSDRDLEHVRSFLRARSAEGMEG